MTMDSTSRSASALPVIGHALRLRRTPVGFLESFAHNSLVRYQVGRKCLVRVCDTDLTRQMLSDDRTFDKGGPINALVQTLVGDGLATCPSSWHRQSRRAIQPTAAGTATTGWRRTGPRRARRNAQAGHPRSGADLILRGTAARRSRPDRRRLHHRSRRTRPRRRQTPTQPAPHPTATAATPRPSPTSGKTLADPITHRRATPPARTTCSAPCSQEGASSRFPRGSCSVGSVRSLTGANRVARNSRTPTSGCS